jgi:uncharacterized protein YgiM (DUF1202 family)
LLRIHDLKTGVMAKTNYNSIKTDSNPNSGTFPAANTNETLGGNVSNKNGNSDEKTVPIQETEEIFKPYDVTVNTPALNVREGPGTDYQVIKVLMNDRKIHTVTEESEKWAKLEIGGWVSLEYIVKSR